MSNPSPEAAETATTSRGQPLPLDTEDSPSASPYPQAPRLQPDELCGGKSELGETMGLCGAKLEDEVVGVGESLAGEPRKAQKDAHHAISASEEGRNESGISCAPELLSEAYLRVCGVLAGCGAAVKSVLRGDRNLATTVAVV